MVIKTDNKNKLILRPCWAEVDLSKISKNLQKIAKEIAPSKTMFVVKCNGYGHGAYEVSYEAQKSGACDFLGVASIEEGLYLREKGINLPILVLGSIYPFEAFEYAIKNNLSITIASLGSAQEVVKISDKLGKSAKCHIKIDTGMGRIGTRAGGILQIAKTLKQGKHINLEGIYSHFSCAHSDEKYTKHQTTIFDIVVDECKKEGIDFKIKHLANSYGMLNFPASRLDMVRTGLAVYGVMKNYEDALQWKSKIVFLKNMPKGSFIGYDNTYKCDSEKKIATIPVGYGDGYFRRLSNQAEVLINGQRCKIVGNISMDMMTIDVSHLKEVNIGDEVVLIGKSKNNKIPVSELANILNTNSYSIICNIGIRVPRVYK
ncbi:MAG: alanine racemase [Elusimicrobiaceae bacterium]|jgi:alanine racemase|nr:alanine racemase [Elusimicrobiaceae bacterium]MBT3955341.1 alanine racemase [Elusimicrobiaceae bacterium]MBT4008477.1 alanine racemase [Elusimicrobiaceae bacterium]MBT4403365.1 alanine racemase [Elusimicrobiaceae bacterium]MBT4440206.1 alanine racemase [Elusimicrobiaceae bacterium]